jgi:hypothetical protein
VAFGIGAAVAAIQQYEDFLRPAAVNLLEEELRRDSG